MTFKEDRHAYTESKIVERFHGAEKPLKSEDEDCAGNKLPTA